MRRPLLVGLGLVVFASLVAASNGAAVSVPERYLKAGEESAELLNGYGTAAVTARSGALFGNIRKRGKVRITDFRAGPKTTVGVSGCERKKRVNSRTIVCAGRDLGVGVYGGRWRVTVKGRDIDLSTVLRGKLGLVGTSGTYSLRSGPARDWPTQRRTFRLG
jgi:hypothetical protein